MWDGLLMLLSLSAIMAVASFLAGILPLSLALSPRQLRFITFLGTGVLVGTSLIVIIPEGIETMYSSAGAGHSHGRRGSGDVNLMSISSQQNGVQLPPKELPYMGRRDSDDVHLLSIPSQQNGVPLPPKALPYKAKRDSDDGHLLSISSQQNGVPLPPKALPNKARRSESDVHLVSVSDQQNGVPLPPKALPNMARRSEALDTDFLHAGAIKAPNAMFVERAADDKHKADKGKDAKEKSHPVLGDDDSTEGLKEGHSRVHPPTGSAAEEKGHQGEKETEPHAYVGISLILGFIVMFLVDVLPEAMASSRPSYQPLHISLSDLSRGPHNASTATLDAATSPPDGTKQSSRGSATTIGLIIHACADGIALGASSTAPSTSLSLIIFLAIMLHKAPAAFGLTSVLLKQGLSKRTARTHLLFFSLAAPGGALATWFLVHTLGRARLGGDDGLAWATGCMLLFSGGTFLYVAMHSMNEATSSSGHDDPTANGYVDHKPNRGSPSKADIATAVVGMLLPLVTQVGHVH